MRTARGAGLVLSLLLASGADAQQIPPVQEIVDVTVANVEVVVMDRAGNGVRGLTSDDFELLEDDVPQRIANFAEYGEVAQPLDVRRAPPDRNTAAAQPAFPAVQPRRVIIFWDLSTTAALRGRELGAAIETLLDDLGPGDEVLIVSWNHGLTVEVPSTPDIELAREGVRQIVKRAVLDDFTKKSPCGETIFRKRELQLLLDNHRQSALALRALLTRVAPNRGRKVLVLVSEGFGAQPGAEILACVQMQEIAREGSKLQESGKSEMDSVRRLDAKTSRSLDAIAEGDMGLREAEELFASLVQAASAASVTLYAVHAAGLIRPDPSVTAVGEDSLVEPPWKFVRRTNSLAGLRRLAEETGGVLAANTNDLKDAFREIAADLGSYYSIGYRIEDPKREGDRRIDIRMRNPDLTARTRLAVSVRPPEAEVSDAVLASLELGDAANDLAIAAVPLPVTKTKRGRFSIPIEVRIPLEPLSFVQEGDVFAANVSLFVAATDPRKASTEVERLDHRIEIRAEDFPKIAGTYYAYGLSIELRGRSSENRVAIGVLDQFSKIAGFTVVTVGAPLPPS